MSKVIDDGGPAEIISLRDWFAGQALAGCCGNSIPGSHHIPEQAAREAYAYADAMILARKTAGEGG